MPRQKRSIPLDCLRRSDRLSLIDALSSTSSCASRTEAKAWNVNRRNTMNTSPQAKRKRGFKRSLLTDDEQENIRPEKKRPPRRSGNADLLAEMATGEGNDYAIFPDPSATIKTEDEDALVMPIERGIVPKDEGIKEDPRDKSPSRVNGVNDGRVMGRPLDDHMRYQLEKKACIVYPFPRHTLFTNDKRGANSRSFQSRSKGKKMLDLMLDGEVDGGGETNKKQEYVIDGVLFMDSESALVNWHGFKFPTWEQREIVKKKDVYSVVYTRNANINIVNCRLTYLLCDLHFASFYASFARSSFPELPKLVHVQVPDCALV